MAIIKCKMCGGDLEITEGVAVAECEYCGAKQTGPSAGSEKKTSLFLRANKLRFDCDFDRAAGIYDSIITDFPAEPEAYWGVLLCKYGIEYVDDPATGKKVPTCHRSSYDSVLEDENLEKVMEYADAVARRVYRDEAKDIEDIRKGIIEISGKERPYDIFICYKETAEDGQRTIDSVLAQDVYDALTGKGYRVFFSRITLEDKLGTEYEPYIFAALNSAKVMLVFGTDYEYFNAVWVKNEWSRFLKLMAQDKSKHLIPCYKDVDAYDMPKEFQKLQAQDMGKVGAVQDLLRGIDKLLGKGQAAPAAQPAPVQVVSAGGPTVDSLLKRAQILLEDRDWKSANEYFDKVLEIDPECAEAYLGKFCAEMEYTNPEMMAQDTRSLKDSRNKANALRFASPELRGRLEKYQQEAERLKQKQEEERNQLLKRGQMFLEDKDWKSANEYFDKVLDIHPECAEAYLGKFCAERQYTNISAMASDDTILYIGKILSLCASGDKILAIKYYREQTRASLPEAKSAVEQIEASNGQDVPALMSDSIFLEKALRFASPELRERLEGYEAAAKQKAQEQDERRRQEQEKERLRRQEEEEYRQQEERRRKEEEQRRKKEEARTALETERARLQAELPTIKGLFSGGKRRQVEARLAEIEAELKKL